MRIYHTDNYDKMSCKAAAIISAQVLLKPNCVLGLATGSTPIGAYQQLVKLHEQEALDFSQVTSVNLDEYRGLSGENPQSYAYFMRDNFFSHVNIAPDHIFLPNGMEPDSEKAASEYEAIIQQVGGIDLQLLGLGHNGHIGFNEPGPVFVQDTHCVDLTPSTISANRRFFDSEEDVPKRAYTMGIRTIMFAKKILLVASGVDKAQILHDAFFGPVTPAVPASILQLHPDVTIVADKEALSKCNC
ncbi:MAG: glucosamine-6-phosphate deaminase [Lachnospiraceae bacterium]